MTRKSRPPNQLHSKMDGFDVRSAVVAIATTNRPDARLLVKNVLGSKRWTTREERVWHRYVVDQTYYGRYCQHIFGLAGRT